MKRAPAGVLVKGLMLLVIVGTLALVLSGCGHVSQNIDRDGYQVGDISEGLKKDKAWYCGPGMMGIRAVARMAIAIFTGTSVPNLCRVVDIVVDQGDQG